MPHGRANLLPTARGGGRGTSPERGDRMRFRLGRVACALVVAVALLPTSISAQAVPTTRPTGQELTTARAADKDWITYGGSLWNQRYSTLDQINAINVGQLKGAWLSRL